MLRRRHCAPQPAAVHGPWRRATRTLSALQEPVGHHPKATVAVVRAPVQRARRRIARERRPGGRWTRSGAAGTDEAQETVSGHPDGLIQERREGRRRFVVVVVGRERTDQPDQEEEESGFRRRPRIVADTRECVLLFSYFYTNVGLNNLKRHAPRSSSLFHSRLFFPPRKQKNTLISLI